MSPEVMSARLSLGFASVGHTFSHLFQPLYYIAVLTLEDELGISHAQAIQLAVLGGLLFGLAAPLAGWLGDRWGAIPLMSIFYIGTGFGMIMTGLAQAPWQIMAGLALTGLFASIYHPVGIAWLIKNSLKRGMALGINGIFGGFGPAIAALTAGTIIALAGWRAVFIIPGVLVILTGLVFIIFVARGMIVDKPGDRIETPPANKSDAIRVFVALAIAMLCTGVIFQAAQASFPKTFQLTLSETLGDGVMQISTIVAVVFFMAGLMQLAGGWLADRISPKTVYVGAFLLQVPVLILIANISGPLVVVAAIIMISANNGALPAENLILTRYVPRERRSLAFGFKFVIAIGFAALGAQLHATMFGLTGGIYWTYMIMGGFALLGAVVASTVPSGRSAPVAQAAE